MSIGAPPLCPDADHRRHLSEGRFMLQRSAGSGTFVYPPRVAQPGSGAADLEWVAASGLGTVHATTVVRCKPPAADYNVALIDLAEGPRLMSRVDGVAPADVRIGMRVRARVKLENDAPLLVFEAISAIAE
jgi:uncharacterized protein